MTISLPCYLTLRFEYEEIVKDYSLPEEVKTGFKENFDWFLKHGYKSNSLRKDFKRAKELSKILLGELNGGTKKITKRL